VQILDLPALSVHLALKVASIGGRQADGTLGRIEALDSTVASGEKMQPKADIPIGAIS
jgi:hypothetical protein